MLHNSQKRSLSCFTDKTCHRTLKPCKDLLCGSQFLQKEECINIQFCPTCPSESLEWTCRSHFSCINCCRIQEIIPPSESKLFSIAEGPLRQCGGWATSSKADNSLCCPRCTKVTSEVCVTHWRCYQCCRDLSEILCHICAQVIRNLKGTLCNERLCPSCTADIAHSCKNQLSPCRNTLSE